MSRNVLSGTALACLCTVCTAFGLKVYLVGNSVTDVVNYNGLAAQATAKGFSHTWARHMIPGAPLEWLWEHRTEGFQESPYGYPENAFANYDWDVLTLQPFDRKLDSDTLYAGKYMTTCHARSTNVQVYIYSRWMRGPHGDTLDRPDVTAGKWDTLWHRTYTGGWDGTEESKDYFERLTQALRALYTSYKTVLMIPAGDVLHLLNDQARAGQLSAYSIDEAWDFYSDGIHFNNMGSYVVGCTFFATIYKTDPRGMSVPSQYGSIPAGLVTIIQNAVWSIVSTHPLAGVSGNVVVSPGPLRVYQPRQSEAQPGRLFALDGRWAPPSGGLPGVFLRQGSAERTVRIVR